MVARNTQPRRPVDGVLLLDKPRGLGSNAALGRVKALFGAKKGGHGGTLDPMASGLLPILLGEATKFARQSLDAGKTYRATIAFGQRTDTGDAEGAVIEQRPVDIDTSRLARVLAGFVGPIDQVPPMYSALKRDGRPLYDYARAGIEVAREPRRVTIASIDLLDHTPASATIRVACSKGTYIRTLAEDIALALGTVGHLSALCRERIDGIELAGAHSLEAIEALAPERRVMLLLPVDALVAAWPRLDLDADPARRFLQGQRVPVREADRPADLGGDAFVRIYAGGRLLGLAVLSEGLLVPERLVSTACDSEAGDDRRDDAGARPNLTAVALQADRAADPPQ